MNNKKIAVFSLLLKSATLVVCMLVVACHYFSQDNDILPLHVDIVQLDAFDQFGYTPLMLAALQGVSSEVARLISAGVHLDTKSKNKDFTSQQIAGNTALMFALFGSNFDGPYESANLLLDAGANVRVVNDDSGYTAVHFLQQVSDIPKRGALLARLIKEGADPNAQGKNGNTLLHFTTMNEREGWVEYCKKNFASVLNFEVANFKGQTPKQYADYLGFTDVVDAFNAPGNIVGLDAQGRPLDINARDPMMHMTGLMLALIRKDTAFASELIKHQADINAKILDNKQNSALHLMLLHQMVDMVEFLVKNNANVNITNADGDSPLQYVLRIDNVGKPDPGSYLAMRIQAAKLLLDKGANINNKNKNGDTLMHQIARMDPAANIIPLVDFLVANYGARIKLDVQNERGQTALQIAKNLGRTQLLNSFAKLPK